MWGAATLALVALLAMLVFVWAVSRIRRRFRDAEELALTVSETEIPDLVAECQTVFANRLGVQISFQQPDEAMQIFEQALSSKRCLDTALAFEKAEHPGWYVRPMGAFLGELIREQSTLPAHWKPSELGGLALQLGNGDEQFTLHPFDKILKQQSTGEPGDLVAYMAMAQFGPPELIRRVQAPGEVHGAEGEQSGPVH